jgi:hypothetical protein
MRITAGLETPPDTPPDGPVREPAAPHIPLHEPDPDEAPSERRTMRGRYSKHRRCAAESVGFAADCA